VGNRILVCSMLGWLGNISGRGVECFPEKGVGICPGSMLVTRVENGRRMGKDSNQHECD